MAIVKNLNSDYSQKRIQLLSEKLGLSDKLNKK